MSPSRPAPAATDRRALEDERDFLLRSLADLDAEAAAGDLGPDDHRALRADYTARAAAVLRALQALDDPVATPDQPQGADDAAAALAAAPQGRRQRPWPPRRLLLAAVAVVVAGSLAVAVTSAVGRRDPGGVATGGAVGTQREADLLLAGAQASAAGDNVKALQDFEAVLKTDPNQVTALTDEGWILAQTQQPQLLAQGIGLLGRAERIQPAYPPPHVYRGVAFLSEGDDPDAVTELRTYLAGTPDLALLPKVRQALAQAEAGAARMGAAAPAGAPAAPAGAPAAPAG